MSDRSNSAGLGKLMAAFVVAVVAGGVLGYSFGDRREVVPPLSASQQLCREVRAVDQLWTSSGFSKSVTPMTAKAEAIATRVDRRRSAIEGILVTDPDIDGMRNSWVDYMNMTANDLRHDETGGEKLEDATALTAPEELRTAIHCRAKDPSV